MPAKLTVVVMGVGLFLAGTAVPLRAHHAFAAEFDAKKPVHFEGTVTKMEWINPHTWIYMDVKKPDGMVEEWMIEVSDDCPRQVDEKQFAELITSARGKAKQRAKRRMEAKQIVKEAFYDFVLTKAKSPFVESFRRLRNEPYV